MSVVSIEVALERIKCATKRSPIAVFKTGTPGYVNTMFANTVDTLELIESGDPKFIGTYHKDYETSIVRRCLRDNAA